MTNQLRPAIVIFVVLTLLTGVAYPLVITGIAQVVFPSQANGSLIVRNDVVVGSSLIGQNNTDAGYFWARPSAISYVPMPSSGSNLTVTNATLAQAVLDREVAFRAANNVPTDVAVPADMVFASGSGLDPHISPAAARLQVERVAIARSLTTEAVSALVESAIEAPQLGILGEPRVNVLLLNLALDALQ